MPPFVTRWIRSALVAILVVLSIAIATPPANVYAQAPTSTPDLTRLSTKNGDLPAPSAGREQTASLVFDVDRDGDNDFVIAVRDDNNASVVWYRRDAAGWTRVVIDAGFMPIEAGGTFYDIDGDGDQDIVFGGDYRSRQVWWWENPYPTYTNPGAWTRRIIKDSLSNMHHDMSFGDVDGDGRAELAFWNQSSKKLLLADIPANPKATQPWPFVEIYAWSGWPDREGLEIVDVDGNGKVDIVGGGSWFEHTSGNSFTEHVIDTGQIMSRAVAGQLIPGGYAEIVMVPGDGDGPLKWYRWTGSQWQATTLIGLVDNGHSLRLIDFNHDGHLDIFVAEMRLNGSNDDAKMWLFYGDGAGGFTQTVLATGIGNHESRVADLDGDGDYDILGKPYDWDTPRLDIWINNAAPTVCTPSLDQWRRHLIDANQRWRAVFVESADINRDGDVDIISGGDWYENPGTPGGNWTRRAIGAPLYNMAAVYDFDGDGDMDILGTAGGSASVYSNAFHWAENNGSGGFTIHSNVQAGNGDFLQGVAIARFQGDLQVALSWHDESVALHALSVPGAPKTQSWPYAQLAPITQGEELTAGDIDRDGDLDLLLGTRWLRNEGSLQSGWHDAARAYRVPLTIQANGTPRADYPAEVTVNFTALLNTLGGGTLAVDSLRVAEVDASGGLINANVPFQFDPAGNFNASSNATGKLIILLTGATSANATRNYQLYFAKAGDSYTPVTVADRVAVTDATDEGQAAFRIAAEGATYFYQKDAAGFSSLLDRNNNDWISFNPTPNSGANGEFRGIPNLVYPEGYFHPGDDNAVSTLISDGPLKAVIESTSKDNAWQARWEIFPHFARMTVTRAGHDYWFLYEGTPGGTLEPATDFVVRADGTQSSAATAWTGDLEPAEWVYFADPAAGGSGRALFVAQHDNDARVDSYYALNGAMTVFGFGRDGVGTFLNSVPRAFTIGLIDETAYSAAAPLVRGAYVPVSSAIGTATQRTVTGSGWSAQTLNSTAGLPDRNRLADINLDGRLDAVIGYESAPGGTERVAWYQQPANPTGTWTERVIATITGPMSIDARDMDGDGDIDVVAGEHNPYNASNTKMFVFENADGRGTAWTQHTVYTGDEHHDGAHAVDIDNDGDLDIVSIGWINDKVVLYENLSDCQTGGGQPTPNPTTTPQPTPTGPPPPTPEPTPQPTTLPPGSCTPAATNLLRNPGFESGTNSWVFYTNGAAGFTATRTNPAQCEQAAQIAVSNSGSNVQLMQTGVALQAGVRYRIRFAGRAGVNRTVGLYLHKDTSPWTGYGLSQEVALTNAWQQYSYEFTASGFSGTTSDSRLRLWLVSVRPGETVWFDDFVLERADTPPPPTEQPTATPPPVNQPPTADAGADQTVTDSDGNGGESVTLNANGSRDSDGSIVRYRWTAAGLTIPNGAIRTVVFPVGVHTVTLTVTDDDGATATDTVVITVNEGAQPTPEPTPEPTTPPPGSCTPAATNLLRNPGFESGTSPWVFYTNGAAGFTATRTNPAQCEQAAQIAVANSGSNVQLMQTGVALQAGVRYRIRFAGRAGVNRTVGLYLHKDTSPWTGYGLSQEVALTNAWQQYSYEFTASGFSGTTTDSRLRLWLVSVRPGETVWFDDFVLERADTPPPPVNQPPTANAGQDQTVTDSDNNGTESVTLNGSGSRDGDGTLVNYHWTATGVTIPDGVSPAANFPVGVHTVTLTVTDDDGATAADTVVITVNAGTAGNQPPTADAGPDQTVTDSDNNGTESVTLNGSGSRDGDGTLVSYVWQATGVTIPNGVNPTANFPVGVHTITLTVTDDDGATAADTVVITVNAGAQPTPEPPPPGSCTPAATNLLRNPGFESGANSWVFYTNGAAGFSATRTNPAQCEQAAQVAVANGGSNVQLMQTGVALQAGVRYRIRFAGRANVNRTVGLYLHKDTSPWTGYGLSQEVALTNAWQQYSYEFTASGFSGTTTDSRLRLWLVSVRPGETVWFDDFVLERADASPPPVNQPPTANAGADQTVTDSDNNGTESVTLNGSGSRDGDGTLVNYRWTATGVTIPDGVSPAANFPVGVHTVTLTVTDDDGATAADTVVITVNAGTAGNQPPTANAGADQTVTDSDNNGTESVTLNGSGSRDGDGTLVNYRWTATGVTIPNGVNPTASFPVGVHTVTLTVTDDDGATAADTVVITVNAGTAGNQPPTANAGPDQTVTDSDNNGTESVTLNGNGSRDGDGTLVSYVWQATGVTIPNGVNPAANFPVGVHTVTLTVTDDDGATAADTVVITVAAAEDSSARVVDGITALYTFGEGSGAVVRDVANAGAPLDLTIADSGAITWLAGGGLALNRATLLASTGPATKIIDGCKATNELTVEAWAIPGNVTQEGPARLATLSSDPTNRNFTLGQGLWGGQPAARFDFRLRTTGTDNNGSPSVTTPNGTATTQLSHIVYTRSQDGAATIYIDGSIAQSGAVSGNFSNWNSSYRFGLANELTGDRPWLGELHLVAVYCRALDADEVAQNHTAGLPE